MREKNERPPKKNKKKTSENLFSKPTDFRSFLAQ